ncbi:MAG: hypothetical protein ACYCO5_00730 [Acidobacteriaceae bacterium]
MDYDNDLYPAAAITTELLPETPPSQRQRARIGRPPATVGYVAMSREQLLEECRQLYNREDISAFTFGALKRHKLYFILYNKGLKLATVLEELGLDEEYRKRLEVTPIIRAGRTTLRWTWARIVSVAEEIAEREGSLPAALWFQSNGYGSLVAAVYNLGHTWADLRAALQDFSNSNFVESRNGLRWLSHAEASLSNFLYARGIEHRKGGKYPDAYAEDSGRQYGIYDLTFLAANGKWIDVEVWGDSPHGLTAEYGVKRTAKEKFNKKNNQDFLGIEFRDCYQEKSLTAILEPFIGEITPFRFDKPTDPLIHSTHWSNADELLDYARQLAGEMPDGRFPTEEWLRKRGKWANRSGEAYNTLSVYIKTWLGGVRNLRRLLDQEHASTIEWTREKALQAYKAFYERYGMTTDQARQQYERKHTVSQDVYLEAARIGAAVSKYVGGATAAKVFLGIDTVRSHKWTRERIVSDTKEIIARYGLSPIQLKYDQRIGRIQLSPELKQKVGQLIDAANRTCGGMSALLAEIGFVPPPRYHRGRRQARDTRHR